MRERAPPPRIFLSYRREDTSGHAGRLYDVLAERFGEENVFMDVDTIKVGADFAEAISRAVASCDALIALIGRQWLAAADANGRRRLDDPNDFVRLELEAALERDVPVVPARVQGASQPTADDLPTTIAPLARRQGVELDDEGWHDDVERLIERLERAVGSPAPSVSPAAPPWWRRAPGVLIALGALIAAVLGLVLALGRLGNDDAPAAKATSGPTKAQSPTSAQYTVALPGGNKATIGEHVYEIVGTRVERRNPGELGLDLVVRFTNNGRFDANFWTRSFRLAVDGAARAPTNDLNEVVPGGTTADGRVAFAFPESAQALALVVEDDVRLPLELGRRSG
jgi:TIR domain-containing protein